MSRQKSGRRKQPGERYASGKLKPESAGLPPAAFRRMLEEGLHWARLDDRLKSQVTRLYADGKLNAEQSAAAMRVGEIYGRYETLKGSRRSVRSASYEIGAGGIPPLDESAEIEAALTRIGKGKKPYEGTTMTERAERMARAKDAYDTLQQEIPEYPPEARGLLERLCVDDEPIVWAELEDLQAMLDRLVRLFKETPEWKRERRHGKPKRHHKWGGDLPPPRSKVLEQAAKAGGKPAHKENFGKVLRALSPKLEPAAIDRAYDVFTALNDRARLNRRRSGG